MYDIVHGVHPDVPVRPSSIESFVSLYVFCMRVGAGLRLWFTDTHTQGFDQPGNLMEDMEEIDNGTDRRSLLSSTSRPLPLMLTRLCLRCA